MGWSFGGTLIFETDDLPLVKQRMLDWGEPGTIIGPESDVSPPLVCVVLGREQRGAPETALLGEWQYTDEQLELLESFSTTANLNTLGVATRLTCTVELDFSSSGVCFGMAVADELGCCALLIASASISSLERLYCFDRDEYRYREDDIYIASHPDRPVEEYWDHDDQPFSNRIELWQTWIAEFICIDPPDEALPEFLSEADGAHSEWIDGGVLEMDTTRICVTCEREFPFTSLMPESIELRCRDCHVERSRPEWQARQRRFAEQRRERYPEPSPTGRDWSVAVIALVILTIVAIACVVAF